MRNIKSYELFVESRKNDKYTVGSSTLNEGFFSKISDGFRKLFGSVWTKLKSKYGKDAWWYAGVLLNNNVGKKSSGLEFYPYSISSSESNKISGDIMDMIDDDQPIIFNPDELDKVSTSDIKTTYMDMANDAKKMADSFVDTPLTERVTDMVSLAHDFIPNIDGKELMKTIIDNFHILLTRGKKFETEDEYYKKGTTKPSIFLWGAPGIAKTSIIKKSAEALGVDLIVWHLSLTEPSDLLGVPGVNKDKRTEFYLPKIFPTSNGPKNKGCIIFFDEMNRAPQAVLAASLSMCLEGKIGPYMLPSKALIVAAGNRPDDLGSTSSVSTIDSTLMNRFEHVNLVLNQTDFENWANKKEDEIDIEDMDDSGKNIPRPKDMSDDDYKYYIKNWFDKSKPEKTNMIPEIGTFITHPETKRFGYDLDTDKSERPWSSTRSWHAASSKIQALGGIESLSVEEIGNIVKRFVSKEAAAAFTDFIAEVKTYDQRKIDSIFSESHTKETKKTKTSDTAEETEKKPDLSLPVSKVQTKTIIKKIAEYKECYIKEISKVPTNLILTEAECKNFFDFRKNVAYKNITDEKDKALIDVSLMKRFLTSHKYIKDAVVNGGGKYEYYGKYLNFDKNYNADKTDARNY